MATVALSPRSDTTLAEQAPSEPAASLQLPEIASAVDPSPALTQGSTKVALNKASGKLPRLDTAALMVPPHLSTGTAPPAADASRPGADLELIAAGPMHKACYDCDLKNIKSIVASSSGEVLEHRDAFFMTPFLTACLCGNLSMVNFLAESGADVFAVDNVGRAAVHYAALNKDPNIIEYLVEERGLDVNVMDDSHRTSLYIAASNGRTDAVEVLLGLGADPAVADDQGRVPLAVACESRVSSGQNVKESIKALLLEHQMRSAIDSNSKGVRRASSRGYQGDGGDDPAALLGNTMEEFMGASALLEKLRWQVMQLNDFRTTTLRQLSQGHLKSFVSEYASRLLDIIQAFGDNRTPWEAPLFNAHDRVLASHVQFETMQHRVRELVMVVPETQVEDNTLLLAPDLQASVLARDERRDALFGDLVTFLDLVKAMCLEESIGGNIRLAAEIVDIMEKRGGQTSLPTDVERELKAYSEVVAQCQACLNQASMWEKEVVRNMEKEGARTTSAKEGLVATLASSMDFTGQKSQHGNTSIESAIKVLVTQVGKEKKLLQRLRGGKEVQPPFPHEELYDVASFVRAEIEKRTVHLRDLLSRVSYWTTYRSQIGPWVKRGAAAIAADFFAGNRAQKEKLLEVESDILDKAYEKAKIQNARMRKGQSQARSSEAEANKQALSELQMEKWAVCRSYKSFLLRWRSFKLEHVPELPLPLSDLLGPLWAQMQVSMADPIVELFCPGMTFADFQLQNAVSGVRREVHVGFYEGKIYALKIFPNLSNNMRVFVRDVGMRLKLHAAAAPIAPVEFVFTEPDHNGTGYMVMKYFDFDLTAWATKEARTLGQVVTVVCKVLEALSSIHHLGIVHGNLKTDNVLMDGHTPLLADFEYAYVDSPPYANSIMFTKSTLEYMAPEMKVGDGSAKATQASDMYSLGVMITKVLEATGLQKGGTLLQGLVAKLCVDKPEGRLTAAQALEEMKRWEPAQEASEYKS